MLPPDIAPIHLPLNVEEAWDKRLLGLYKPRPWSFLQLANTVALLSRSNKNVNGNNAGNAGLDSKQNVGPAPDATAQSPPKKKAWTINQLIAELYSNPKVDLYLTPRLHLQRTHAMLQHKLSWLVHAYVHNYTGYWILQEPSLIASQEGHTKSLSQQV